MAAIKAAASTLFPGNTHWGTTLKALVVKNSVLHDFGFWKVSWIHETFLMELQLFGWRHFSKTEVVQNTDLNIITLWVLSPIFWFLIRIIINCGDHELVTHEWHQWKSTIYKIFGWNLTWLDRYLKKNETFWFYNLTEL